jgi:hypothetical protein
MLVFFVLLSKPVKRQRNHETNGMYHSLQNDVRFSQDQLAKYQSLRKEQMQKKTFMDYFIPIIFLTR